MFNAIAEELMIGEAKQFRSKAGWAPLEESTKERKHRQGHDVSIMRETGAIERALTVRAAPGQRLDISRRELVFGLKGGRSEAFYGRFHQRGKGVPKRRVVVMSRQTKRRTAQLVRRHLVS